VGGADINNPIKEPTQAIKDRIPMNPKRDISLVKLTPAPRPRIKTTIIERIIENNVDARMIPKRMRGKLRGDVIWRSKPFSRVSHGMMTGLIAVDVKKIAIDAIPMNNRMGEISRPMTHVRVMKKGNNNPKIKTGPFLKYNRMFFTHNAQICLPANVKEFNSFSEILSSIRFSLLLD
jgi:hypothetical protein